MASSRWNSAAAAARPILRRRCLRRCSGGLTASRHTPRKRGIQYAEAFRSIPGASGILDRPPSRAMTRECVVLPLAKLREAPGSSILPSLELRLALFHKSLPALAKILGVHAGGADVLDRVHVALVGILQHLRDGDLGGFDRERRVAGDGAGAFHGRAPEFSVGQHAIDKADPQ